MECVNNKPLPVMTFMVFSYGTTTNLTIALLSYGMNVEKQVSHNGPSIFLCKRLLSSQKYYLVRMEGRIISKSIQFERHLISYTGTRDIEQETEELIIGKKVSFFTQNYPFGNKRGQENIFFQYFSQQATNLTRFAVSRADLDDSVEGRE